MYTYDIFEFIGNIGVIILIITYFLFTIGKLKDNLYYLLLNVLAASLLLINLLVHVNISGILIEIFWILISVIGILKELRKRVVQKIQKIDKKINK